jgi:calcineurin-like phosphoesterase family protein
VIEFFHISDLHVGRILGGSHTTRTRELIGKLENKFHILTSKNKYLLITGDITDRGTKAFCAKAISILRPYKGKVHFVPGNHDYSECFASGFFYNDINARRFDAVFAEELDSRQVFYERRPFFQILDDGENTKVCVIGLNSCLKLVGGSSAGATFGLLGHKQISGLDKWLNNDRIKRYPKLVYLHHIPYQPAKGYLMNLLDWDDLMEVLKNRVDIVAFGHEGKMREPRAAHRRKIDPASRMMRARHGEKWGIKYFLDANHSLKAKACYHIRISGRHIEANKCLL